VVKKKAPSWLEEGAFRGFLSFFSYPISLPSPVYTGGCGGSNGGN
jgi:hypothetical protein